MEPTRGKEASRLAAIRVVVVGERTVLITSAMLKQINMKKGTSEAT